MRQKITLLALLSIIYFVNSSHTSSTFDDDFFTLSVTGDQNSDFQNEGFVNLQIINDGIVVDDLSYDGWRFNGYQSETGIYPQSPVLTNDTNSGVKIYTADSSNFRFISIDYLIDTRGNPPIIDITFYGFRDGVQVESKVLTAADTALELLQ